MSTRSNLLEVEQSRRCFGCPSGANLALLRGAGPPHLVHALVRGSHSLPRPAPSFSGRYYKAKRYCSAYSFGTVLLTEPHPPTSKQVGYLTGRSGNVHSAKVPDQDGIKLLLKTARERLPRLSHLRVDAGYQGRGKEWVEQDLGSSIEVVRRSQCSRRSQGSGPRSGRRKERRSTGRGYSHVGASSSCRGAG